jgi:tRNA pseudouridine32 synthase / 23S rRNA pseudouridine746 synthase
MRWARDSGFAKVGNMTPEEMVSRLLYRDGLMLVIDKPTGFAVHRGPKGGESLEDHFDALRFGLPRPPSLAHRLDRDTSGCLVLGRHRKALALLGRLFKSGAVKKNYWAVVEGEPAEAEGIIELPLGRLDETRGWWMKHDPNGQPAVTKWTVMGNSSPPTLGDSLPLCGVGVGPLAASGDALHHLPAPLPALPHKGGGKVTWLALEPITGRTHQLRVHCAEMGWPIIGDTIYGSAPRGGGPILHLHAREIVVPISKNRDPIRVTAPTPPHMREALTACGWSTEEVEPQHESFRSPSEGEGARNP